MNIITAVSLQFVTAVSGLLLPRMFIVTYGSDANGLISSITQFLAYISLLEGGIGGIIVASLYKPLLAEDKNEIMSIVSYAKHIYRKIGVMFVVYIAVLLLIFPKVVDTPFDTPYVVTLILILSIGTLFQYFFSLAYINLISADQSMWISNLMNIIMLTVNFFISYALIRVGCSLHVVKLISSLVYLLKPLFYCIYVNIKFGKIDYISRPKKLKQVWNGFAHHISYFILNNTDVVIITLVLGVKEVSVYAVYLAVVSGIERMVSSISSGVAAGIGSIIAEDDHKRLNRVIDEFETLQYVLTTILFTITGIMIIPFARVYMGDVADVNYIRPGFAYAMVLAFATNCIGRVYSTITLNAGHYKETQNGAFGQALLNIVISAICVFQYGITGVAIGTVLSMIFRCVYDVIYLKSNIARRNIKKFVKNIFALGLSAAICIYISSTFICAICNSWGQWIGNSMIVAIITTVVSIVIYSITDKEEMIRLYSRLMWRIKKS